MQIEKDEIPMIKDVVDLTDKYEDTALYLKVCIRFGQVEEAMQFVNSQIHNENFTREQQDKLREIKKEIQENKRKCIAMEILKSQQGVKEAVKRSGLPKTTVIQLNCHLVLQKAQENRKKEENDEGEEQDI